MILGEFMKKVKRKVNRKRIAIVVLIPVICIALLIANFTSIRLSIKGYHKEDKKVVLKLEKDDIKDILDYDQIIDISKWDKVKMIRTIYCMMNITGLQKECEESCLLY